MPEIETINEQINSEAPPQESTDAIQYVVFSLKAEEYAIQVDYVQEIIKKQDVTRIPKTLPYVAGMINLRGHIVPVIDSKKLFNIESSSDSLDEEQIMLLDLEKETVGLIVDSVTDVIYVDMDKIEPPPATAGVNTEYIHGVGKYDNRLLMLLKPESFYKDV